MSNSKTELADIIIRKIARNWFYFKVCDCCDAVVDISDPVCPMCNAYRFNTEKEEVIRATKRICNNYKEDLTYNGLE